MKTLLTQMQNASEVSNISVHGPDIFFTADGFNWKVRRNHTAGQQDGFYLSQQISDSWVDIGRYYSLGDLTEVVSG